MSFIHKGHFRVCIFESGSSFNIIQYNVGVCDLLKTNMFTSVGKK